MKTCAALLHILDVLYHKANVYCKDVNIACLKTGTFTIFSFVDPLDEDYACQMFLACDAPTYTNALKYVTRIKAKYDRWLAAYKKVSKRKKKSSIDCIVSEELVKELAEHLSQEVLEGIEEELQINGSVV